MAGRYADAARRNSWGCPPQRLQRNNANDEVPLFRKPCFQGISLSHKVFVIQCESGTSYGLSTERQFVSTKFRRSLCPCKPNPVLFLFTAYGPTAHASAN